MSPRVCLLAFLLFTACKQEAPPRQPAIRSYILPDPETRWIRNNRVQCRYTLDRTGDTVSVEHFDTLGRLVYREILQCRNLANIVWDTFFYRGNSVLPSGCHTWARPLRGLLPKGRLDEVQNVYTRDGVFRLLLQRQQTGTTLRQVRLLYFDSAGKLAAAYLTDFGERTHTTRYTYDRSGRLTGDTLRSSLYSLDHSFTTVPGYHCDSPPRFRVARYEYGKGTRLSALYTYQQFERRSRQEHTLYDPNGLRYASFTTDTLRYRRYDTTYIHRYTYGLRQ